MTPIHVAFELIPRLRSICGVFPEGGGNVKLSIRGLLPSVPTVQTFEVVAQATLPPPSDMGKSDAPGMVLNVLFDISVLTAPWPETAISKIAVFPESAQMRFVPSLTIAWGELVVVDAATVQDVQPGPPVAPAVALHDP